MVFRCLKNTVVFSVVAAAIISAGAVGFFAACDDPNNPFSNSLGAKVDIEPPTITVVTPISGAYIKGVARFEGEATAYRELQSIEIKIYDPDETKDPILDWTTTGVHWKEGGDAKKKEWYYDLDTRNFYGPARPIIDGFLKMQFRARDVNLLTDTVELVYIIKNDPSIVKLTAPDSAKLETEEQPPKIGTNTEIRGQILDRRGIKPGYPRIKIWPEGKPEPAGDAIGDPVNGWGWVTLFLSGIDDPEQGTGYYADRRTVPVERAANFVFRLSQFTIVDDQERGIRRAVYDLSGQNGTHKQIDPGTYRFRILTSDTFFNSDVKDEDPEKAAEKARVYLWPRDPIAANDEEEAVGYYPTDTESEDPYNNGKYHAMQLVTAGVRPHIELDNSDISPSVLEKLPNIYMNEPTIKKTVKNNQDIFRLRILTAIDGGLIEKAILQWEHNTSKGRRTGFLAWDDIGSDGYVDDTSEGTKAELGHRGETNIVASGKNFVFTADGSHKDSNNDPVFVSSSEPYSLMVTSYSTDGIVSQPTTYNVYLDGSSPRVEIRSIMGAYSPPSGDPEGPEGALINESPYVVNGNIQVSVDRSAGMGIASAKWIVEEDKPDYLDDTGTILQKLKTYFETPTAETFEFYHEIGEGKLPEGMTGKVQEKIPSAAWEADRNYHLKFNTTQLDGKDLWLYVIAEDTVQNLGYTLQKLHVDSSTDRPGLVVSNLDSSIDNESKLLYGLNPTRKNVLSIYEGINLTVTDDDGVSLGGSVNGVTRPSGIEITLTDLNVEPPKSVSVPVGRNVMTAGTIAYEENSSREWSGLLSPQIMATAMYGQNTTKTSLDDGLYSIAINVRDNVGVKVAIAGNRPGDQPVSVAAADEPQKFFFAVRSQGTVVDFASPTPNKTVSSNAAVPVNGTVRSPFEINQSSIKIAFTPNVLTYLPNIGATIQLVGSPTREGGSYVYSWEMSQDINFAPTGLSTTETERRIEVTAVDGLGYTGSKSVTVVVDNVPPDVRLTAFNFDRLPQRVVGGVPEYTINGKVPFTINVYDPGKIKTTGNLANICWWVAAAPPTWPDTAVTPPFPAGTLGGRFSVNADENNNEYGAYIDTTKLTKGTYSLYVIAQDTYDNINNPAVALQQFIIDQDSDYPGFDENGRAPYGGQVMNTVNTPLVFSGTVTDDDGFDQAKFTNTNRTTAYVQIRFPKTNSETAPAQESDWDEWIVISGTTALRMGAGGEITFSYTPAANNAHLTGDGTKYYQIKVTDEAIAGANNNPPGKNPDGVTTGADALALVSKTYPATGSYSFYVKNNPPAVYFKYFDPNPAHTEGQATNGRNVYNNRPVYKNAADMVSDLAGGYVWDKYLDTGTLSIIYDNTTQALPATKDGVDPYKYNWNTATLNASLTERFNNGAQGMHMITIVTADTVGNVFRAEWSFFKDDKPPTITGPSAGSVIKENQKVNGTFYDELSPVVILEEVGGELQIKTPTYFDYRFFTDPAARGSYTTGNAILLDKSDPSGRRANWELAIPATGLVDGLCYVEIQVADTFGNSGSEMFSFMLDRAPPLVSPVDRITISGTGISATPIALDEFKRVFSAAETTPAATVAFTLKGLVYDRNLTELTTAINPGGEQTAIEMALSGAAFETWVKGTTAGPYPSATAQFRVTKATSADRDTHSGTDIYTQSAGDFGTTGHLYVWALEVNRGNLATLLSRTPSEKERRFITVTAKDIAQHSAANEKWNFYLDKTRPDVKFLNANWAAGTYTPTTFGTLNLQGTITDDTYVKTLEFTLAKWVHTTTYDSGSWRYYDGKTGGAQTWSLTAADAGSWVDLLGSSYDPWNNVPWTLSSTTLNGNAFYGNPLTTEGRYRIDLRFTDYSLSAGSTAGNPGTIQLEFYIDDEGPKITWPATKEYYRTADLTFALTASDINSVLTPTAVVRRTEGTPISVPATAITVTTVPTGNPPANAFTVNLTAVTGLTTTGRYTLALTVTDRAGNVAATNSTLDFYVDNTPPAIEVTPAATDAIVGRVEFQGKFTKDTGLSPVSRVAFAVGGTLASHPTTNLTDAGLTAAGWVFSNGNDVGVLTTVSGGTTIRLMQIDQGLTAAKILLFDTRNFNGTSYLGAATTSTITFNGATVTNATVHALNVYFLAIDEAGNVRTATQTYYVYPEGDRPIVTAINNPNPNSIEAERLLNGKIRINGTAEDNVRVKNVWFRVLDMEKTGTPSINLNIPKWDTSTWEQDGTDSQPHGKSLDIPSVGTTSGWYMARGGNNRKISWYEYINNDGELDPEGSATTRRIKIEVVAEDAMLNPDGDGYLDNNTMISRPREVIATVVQGAPRFEDEWVRLGGSNNTLPSTANGWGTVATTNVSKRAAYAVAVKHEIGVSAIRWIRGAGDTVNLLEGNTYTTATYSTDLANMNNATPTGTGIAIKAEPRTTRTGTLAAADLNKPFMIWNPIPAASLNNIRVLDEISGAPRALTAAENQRYHTFTLAQAGSIGTGTLVDQTAGVEWAVVVDLNTTILGNGIWKDAADWFSLNFSASEVSRSVPLLSNYTAQIPVDNIPPQGAYSHTTNVVGTSSTFGGEAGDEGTVAGLSRVVLWFSRTINGTETSILWDEKSAAGTFASVTKPTDIKNIEKLPASVLFPNTYTEATASGNRSSVVIDRNDPGGAASHHGHRLPMGLAASGIGLGTSWYVELNSTNITSGRVTAHYVVYDKAGNATYYSQKLMILNGKPSISRVTLATDIRGGSGLNLPGTLRGTGTGTGNLVNGSATITNSANLIGNAKGSSALTLIRNRFGTVLSGITGGDAAMGISDVITVNTDRLNDYNVVYDNPFTVRNNLLAMQVETVIAQTSGKTRSFRLEYVQNAALISGLTGGSTSLIAATGGIRAGRMYIINEPGSQFPWGLLGVQGEAPRKGLAFIAMENGAEANIPAGAYGSPSVWELNRSYYSGDTLTRTIPAALQLDDVNYATTGNGTYAEFVYQSGAFAAGGIRDYDPQAGDFADDGRPKSYPFASISNTKRPDEAHSLFILRIFEGTEDELFGDFALLSIRVNNNDKTKPYAQLYDLNPKTEGVDATQTPEEAARPYPGTTAQIGQNRVRGGLYNTGTPAYIAKSGHIEPREGTSLTSGEMGGAASAGQASIQQPLANTGAYFTYDTVSGDIIVRGYAEDDTRIDSVDLIFSTTGTGATTQTVTLLEKATGIESGANKFFLQVPANANTTGRVEFTENIDLNRHRVEWSYRWSTEDIPKTTNGTGTAIVVGNVTVRARAYNTNTTKAESPQLTRAAPPNPRTLYDYCNPGFPVSGTRSNTTTAGLGEYQRYNQIDVQIRPYITGILRNTNDGAHNERSRQGRYMLRRGETAVVSGFNLGSVGTTAISLSTATGNVVTPGDFGLPTAPALHYRQFTVNTAQTTGDGAITLTVTANATAYPAVNNAGTIPGTGGAGQPAARTRTIQPWNTEYTPGKTNESELWDDFTAVHIWLSNDTNSGTNNVDNGSFASTADWVILNPAMSVNPANGRLYASYNEGGVQGGSTGGTGDNTSNGAFLMGTDNAGSNSARLMYFRDPMIHSDVYSSATDIWRVTSIIGVSTSTGGGTVWRSYGGIYIHGPDGGSAELSSGSLNAINQSANFYLAESTWYNAAANSGTTTIRQTNPPSTDQFLNPHIITSGTNDLHIHVSYYDSKDKSIKYRYNRKGATGTIDLNVANPPTGAQRGDIENIPKMWTNLDGGYDADDTMQTYYTSNLIQGYTNPLPANTRVVNQGNNTVRPVTAKTESGVSTAISTAIGSYTGIDAGEHNAIAVTSGGFPVVAYYDATNQRLKLAVSNSVSPILGENWVIRDKVIPDGLYQFGTGQFVSIAIDARITTPANPNLNVIHIAAMNTNGNLVYIRGKLDTSFTTATRGAVQTAGSVLTNVTVQVVDSRGTVGRWCNISLDEGGNPWIAYQDTGYIDAKDGVKLAYLDTARFRKGIVTTSDQGEQGEDIDLHGKSISGWETMHVPTDYRVANPFISGPGENGRIGLECYPARNYTAGTPASKIWSAAVGYLSTYPGDKYRVAYYVK